LKYLFVFLLAVILVSSLSLSSCRRAYLAGQESNSQPGAPDTQQQAPDTPSVSPAPSNPQSGSSIPSNPQSGSSNTQTGGATANQPPQARIISITPATAKQGTPVSFRGEGLDSDSTVKAYLWKSNIDGILSREVAFVTDKLSEGTHVISFQVMDSRGARSDEVTSGVVINTPAASPSGAASQSGPNVNKPLEVQVRLEANPNGEYGYYEYSNMKVSYNINQKARVRICRLDALYATPIIIDQVMDEGSHDINVISSGPGQRGVCVLTVTAETTGGARESSETVYYVFQPGENRVQPWYEKVLGEYSESDIITPMDAGISITEPYNPINGYMKVHYRINQHALVTMSVYYPNGDNYDIMSDHAMGVGSYDMIVQGGNKSGTGKIKITAVSHNGTTDKKYVEYVVPGN